MNEDKKKLLLTAMFAGAMIGVGCMVFLACESKALGSFLFSAGLFFVLTYGGTLFTGICGLKTPWKKLVAVFLLNGVGIFLSSALTWTGGPLPDAAAAVMRKKIALSPLNAFANGLLCGAMMYLGVTGFKKARDGVTALASVLYAVPVFIIAMFEHSIADMGYLFIALTRLELKEIGGGAWVIAIVAIGNVVGSKIVRMMTDFSEPR